MIHSAALSHQPLANHSRSDRWPWLPAARLARALFQDAVLVPALEAWCAPFEVTYEAPLDLAAGPFLVVANHSSHVDTPALLAALPPALRHRSAVAAAEDYFYRGRVRGCAASLVVGTFPFPRRGAAGLQRAADLLADGWSVVLFPEGTRSPDGRLRPFKAGVGWLQRATRRPLLPVGIVGAHAVWPRQARFPRPAPLSVRVGVPWLPDECLGPEAIAEELARRVALLGDQTTPAEQTGALRNLPVAVGGRG